MRFISRTNRNRWANVTVRDSPENTALIEQSFTGERFEPKSRFRMKGRSHAITPVFRAQDVAHDVKRQLVLPTFRVTGLWRHASERARLDIALTVCDGVLQISITVADPES
jgi:hypothetical protein